MAGKLKNNLTGQVFGKLPVGVQKYKNRFTAQINLGSFETAEEAQSAYLAAAVRLSLIEPT